MIRQTPTVLLVEDDEVDVMVIRRAFQKSRIQAPLVVASDGMEALEILRGEGGKSRLAPPYIVLLDLNMPRMNGIEFLDELRRDPELRTTVVFVLTTSDAPGDVQAAFAHCVAGYFCKRSLSDYQGTVDFIGAYLAIGLLSGA